ncbi:MAG: TetR/AcrR family transcriptional regulator [Deltaproteobacteria bacterium]|nr:MAG: TetR/AcrR family transcriptional regulator [Deltaproteobacteria bacterium]
MVWQRARSKEQKEQRRTALLAAASRLLESHDLDHISLNRIAREANISKANVYRYFESREELFLHLVLETLEHLVGVLVRRLGSLSASGDERGVARAFASTIAEYPRFARLSSVLGTVLERNVSADTVADFKNAYLRSMTEVVAAVASALPDLATEDAAQLVQTCLFVMVGMWPAAHPAPAVSEALKRPELAAFRIDFEADLERILVTAIRGLRAARTGPEGVSPA